MMSKESATKKLKQLISDLSIVEEELYKAIKIMEPRFKKVIDDEEYSYEEVLKEEEELKELKAGDRWNSELIKCIEYFFTGKSSYKEYLDRANKLNFGYMANAKDRQGFKDAELLVTDMIEEINTFWSHKNNDIESKINPWISGSFYLTSFVIIIVLILVIAKSVHIIYLPIVIICGLLTVSLIGAFQLRQDKNLSEKNFIHLIALTFRQLKFLRNQGEE